MNINQYFLMYDNYLCQFKTLLKKIVDLSTVHTTCENKGFMQETLDIMPTFDVSLVAYHIWGLGWYQSI